MVVVLGGLFPLCVNGASYTLAKEYSGETFFNDWTYYDNYTT